MAGTSSRDLEPNRSGNRATYRQPAADNDSGAHSARRRVQRAGGRGARSGGQHRCHSDGVGNTGTATMDQVTAITAAYGIDRCEVDVINTTIHVAAYRGPTSPAASTLHIVQSRSMDFSRLAAVDRLIGRIRAGQVSPSKLVTSLTSSSPRRTHTSAGSPPLPGVRWRSRRREPWAPVCWPAWSAL